MKNNKDVGRRIVAYLIDTYLLLLLFLMLLSVLKFKDAGELFETNNLALNVVRLVVFVLQLLWQHPQFFILLVLYYIFKDALFNGRSIGKRILGLKVIDVNSKKPCTYWQSFKRNILLRIPYFGLIELIVIIVSEDGRRLGDQIAKTKVIRS